MCIHVQVLSSCASKTSIPHREFNKIYNIPSANIACPGNEGMQYFEPWFESWSKLRRSIYICVKTLCLDLRDLLDFPRLRLFQSQIDDFLKTQKFVEIFGKKNLSKRRLERKQSFTDFLVRFFFVYFCCKDLVCRPNAADLLEHWIFANPTTFSMQHLPF